MTAQDGEVRVAALGDLHMAEHDVARIRELVRMVNGEADLFVLCGDLTDHGHPEEAKALADGLANLSVPCAAVLGNHDHETNGGRDVARALREAGVRMLDGDHAVLAGVGVAGVKGFGGGFGHASLQAFGEAPIKAFVGEAVAEALKLESALGQLETDKKVVLLHYAPVVGTTVGENPEVCPFLGSSRLAAPIDAYGASVVFHGHVHHGALDARTPGGIRVFNVAEPLLRRNGLRLRVVSV